MNFLTKNSNLSFFTRHHSLYVYMHTSSCLLTESRREKIISVLMSLWFCHYEKRRRATKFQLCHTEKNTKNKRWIEKSTQKSPENNHSSRFLRLKQIDFFMRWFVSFLIASREKKDCHFCYGEKQSQVAERRFKSKIAAAVTATTSTTQYSRQFVPRFIYATAYKGKGKCKTHDNVSTWHTVCDNEGRCRFKQSCDKN